MRCRSSKPRKEDTLTDIARRFNVGYEEILRANPKRRSLAARGGSAVVVPTRSSSCRMRRAPGIVINIAAMRLFYFPPHKKGERRWCITHPIGIGKVGWRRPRA